MPRKAKEPVQGIPRKSKSSSSGIRAINDLMFVTQHDAAWLSITAVQIAHVCALISGGLVADTPEGVAKYFGIEVPEAYR